MCSSDLYVRLRRIAWDPYANEKENAMNIVIGVGDSARELHLDIDTDEAGLIARIEEAVSQSTLLDLTDSKG